MIIDIIHTINNVLSETNPNGQGNIVHSDGQKIWGTNGILYIEADYTFPKGSFFTPILAHALNTLEADWKETDSEETLLLTKGKTKFKLTKLNVSTSEQITFPDGEYNSIDVKDIRFVSQFAVKTRLSPFGKIFFDKTNIFASDNSKLGIVEHKISGIENVSAISIPIDVVERIIQFSPTKIMCSDLVFYFQNIYGMKMVFAPFKETRSIPYNIFLNGDILFQINFPDLSNFVDDIKKITVEASLSDKLVLLDINKKGFKLKASSSYGEFESVVLIDLDISKNFRLKTTLPNLEGFSGKTVLFEKHDKIMFGKFVEDNRISIFSISTVEE